MVREEESEGKKYYRHGHSCESCCDDRQEVTKYRIREVSEDYKGEA